MNKFSLNKFIDEEFKMSNGICVVAQNNDTTDYVRQTYGLACSVLANNPNTNISIITNDNVPEKFKKVFDKIIEMFRAI